MNWCCCVTENKGDDTSFNEHKKTAVYESMETSPPERLPSVWNKAHDIDYLSDRLVRVTTDSHEVGDLVYTPTQEAIDEFSEILDQIKQGADSSDALRAHERNLDSMVNRNIVSTDDDASMMMALTNFSSAGSSRAIAQLFQLHALSERMAEPLLVFNIGRKATLSWKEVETKRLVAELSLGYTKCHVLSPNGKFVDVQTSKNKHTKLREKYSSAYNEIVSAIADKLSAFAGKMIYLYIMAPGDGNLHAIISALKDKGTWPLRATKWVVSLYSGSYNMKGMTREDLLALEEIMKHSDKPMLDVAKYTFFGKSPQPPVAESAERFAAKGFAGYLSSNWPLLAAGIKMLNDIVNEDLVDPNKKHLFQEELNEEEKHRFHEISALYNPGDKDSIRAYCEALCCDDVLFSKLQSFKRSTFSSFSLGGCDSPLSDQLIFLHNWLQGQYPIALSYVIGKWTFNEKQGFTEILPGVLGGIQAMQPKLVNPWDAAILLEMREALFEYFKKHLDGRKVPTSISRNSFVSLPREIFVNKLVEEELSFTNGQHKLLLNLMDNQWENRHLAVVLRAIGKKFEDLPKLQEIIAGLFEKESLRNFVDSLVQIREHYNPFNKLSSGDSSHRAEAIWVLGELAARHPKSAKAIAILLMHTILADKQCRAEAAKALVKVGAKDSQLVEAIASVLQKAVEEDAFVNTFSEAARSLGKLGILRCTDQLLGALSTSTVAEKRQIAASMLGKFVANYSSETAKVAPALMIALEQDHSPMVQAAAAQALGMLDRKNQQIVGKAIDSILSALNRATSSEVRVDAINALSKLAETSQNSWSRCLSVMQDTALGEAQPWKVRVEAVKALGVFGKYDVIYQVLESAQNDDTRECAAITLGRIALARPEQKAVILQHLERALSINTSAKVKTSCAKALVKLGAHPPKNQLLEKTDDTYSSNEHIRTALEGKDTILLKGSWLLSLGRRGQKLPQRQEMPKDSVWDVQDLMEKVEHIIGDGKVQIVSVSYCWQTKEHPDPNCEQLYKLCRIIEQLLARSPFDDDYGISDLAMFLDFCSLYQPERTDEEEKAFFRALGSINLWYAHRSTVVWLMTAVPVLSLSWFRPYGDRGWPSFERAICELFPSMDGVYDMGKMSANCVNFGKKGQKGTAWRCKAGRGPPQIPVKFNAALQDKVFTDSSDHEFVMTKYEQTFQEVMGSVHILSCGGLDWGNKAALSVAESLEFCTQLKDLFLDRNKIGDTGARMLAVKFPHCKSLKRLWLGGNMISDIGAKALAEAIPQSSSLEKLGLFHNRISDNGAIALAEGIGNCSTLESISLAENFIGDTGARKLFEVLPACKKLKFFDLSKNLITLVGLLGLTDTLPNTKLEILLLKDNQFKNDVAAAKFLTGILPKCPCLTDESKKALSMEAGPPAQR